MTGRAAAELDAEAIAPIDNCGIAERQVTFETVRRDAAALIRARPPAFESNRTLIRLSSDFAAIASASRWGSHALPTQFPKIHRIRRHRLLPRDDLMAAVLRTSHKRSKSSKRKTPVKLLA